MQGVQMARIDSRRLDISVPELIDNQLSGGRMSRIGAVVGRVMAVMMSPARLILARPGGLGAWLVVAGSVSGGSVDRARGVRSWCAAGRGGGGRVSTGLPCVYMQSGPGISETKVRDCEFYQIIRKGLSYERES